MIGKELMKVGSDGAINTLFFDLGAGILYAMGNSSNDYSFGQLAATSALGTTMTSFLVHLPPLRWIHCKDEAGDSLFPYMVNFALNPAGLILASKILGVALPLGDAFMFGYLGSGMGFSAIGAAGIMVIGVGFCCYETFEFRYTDSERNLNSPALYEPLSVKPEINAIDQHDFDANSCDKDPESPPPLLTYQYGKLQQENVLPSRLIEEEDPYLDLEVQSEQDARVSGKSRCIIL